MRKEFLFDIFIWLLFPFIIIILYPFIEADTIYLGWMQTALILYALFFSIIVHELFHGLAAKWCGDDTAENAGRLSISLFSHISIFGSILVPLGLYFFKAPVLFGWAKPVPFNPAKLKNFKRDQIVVAMAGPFSNFTLAYLCFNLYLIFTLIFNKIHSETPLGFDLNILNPILIPDIPFANIWFVLMQLLLLLIVLNLVLGIFNLIPFPPLDGSFILKAILPKKASVFYSYIHSYGFIFLILAIWFNFITVFFYPIIIILVILQGIGAIILGS